MERKKVVIDYLALTTNNCTKQNHEIIQLYLVQYYSGKYIYSQFNERLWTLKLFVYLSSAETLLRIYFLMILKFLEII